MSQCANHPEWTCESWDVTTAFLQGIAFEDVAKYAEALKIDIPLVERHVYLVVPGNVWYHLYKLGFLTREQYHLARLGLLILQCTKCVYGLVDAPLLWALALRYHFQVVMGGVPSVFDENTFIWRAASWPHQPIAEGTCHIDDTNFAGRQATLDELRKRWRNGLAQSSDNSSPTHT